MNQLEKGMFEEKQKRVRAHYVMYGCQNRSGSGHTNIVAKKVGLPHWMIICLFCEACQVPSGVLFPLRDMVDEGGRAIEADTDSLEDLKR